MNLLEVNDVWTMYKIRFEVNGKPSWENFWAVKGISFNVKKGQVLGLIGANGAGKSTILKLISGMLKPDRGKIEVSGRVSGLLELGAGFQAELTGKENIFLISKLFGLSSKQVEQIYQKIIDFADLGKFIYAPVKCYSQGMFVRLAFSIAVHVEPEILLIDDTLSVGDAYFQQKCLKKMFELKEQGQTIIIVSHDMNILKRLCHRVILIQEGRLIKDDSAEKVAPFYNQIVGVKEGICLLEKGPLSVVFNNGRLFFNWHDELLNPDPGGHLSLRVDNNWYSSTQAAWGVKTKNHSEMIARGSFCQLGLTQIWRLALRDNYEIDWTVEIESQNGLKLQEGCVNILLNNEYSQWFTPVERGKFKAISRDAQDWQDFSAGSHYRKCVGVEAQNNHCQTRPNFVFEHMNSYSRSHAHILNTDYLLNCRVLQYRTQPVNINYDAQAKPIPYFSGKIIVNLSDVNKYLQDLQVQFSLCTEKLKLIFDQGQLMVFYDNQPLTKTPHLGTSLLVGGRWFDSRLGQWKTDKLDGGKLILKGRWPGLPITQTWVLQLKGQDCFSWEIDMEVNEQLRIQEQRAQFVCQEGYTFYFCDYKKGKFPDKFLEVELDLVQRCIPKGVIGLIDQDRRLPSLAVSFTESSNNFAKIFNADFYHQARILRLEQVEPQAQTKFSPGKYSCFKIEASLDKKENLSLTEGLTGALSAKNLDFSFEQGRGTLFWKGHELTKGLGFYTSVRSLGRWHDSYSKAIWKVIHWDDKMIRVAGEWLFLPVLQNWEIVVSDNSFDFTINTKLKQPLEVERLQTNLMLSEKYSEWRADSESGFYPEFKSNIDDEWDCMRRIDSVAGQSITAAADLRVDALPSVSLMPKMQNQHCYLNILNSDISYRGRVLQLSDFRRRVISAGEDTFLSGTVSIA